MKKHIIVFLILASGLVVACTYDKKELEYPSNVNTCDTTVVSYRTDIVSILNANCYSCHSGTAEDGSGIALDMYDNIASFALDGTLAHVVQHDLGYSQMPKGAAKLSDCNIAKIRTWARNGAPNN